MEESTSQESLHSRRSYLYDTTKKENGSKKLFIIIGIIILILAIGGAIFAINGASKKEDITPTPTPTQEITPTETETPTPSTSVTPTPSKKVTPTPTKPKTTTTDASGLDRSTLSIAIQNGGGVPGAGSKMSTILKDLGYNVLSAGNADNFDYEKTVIEVKSTKKEFLDLLKKDLSGSYTIGTTSATLTGSSADAIVIVGKN